MLVKLFASDDVWTIRNIDENEPKLLRTASVNPGMCPHQVTFRKVGHISNYEKTDVIKYSNK